MTAAQALTVPVLLALGNLERDDLLCWLDDASETKLGSAAFEHWLVQLVSAEQQRRNGEPVEAPVPQWQGLPDAEAGKLLQAGMGLLLLVTNDKQHDLAKYAMQCAVAEACTRLSIRGILGSN